MISFIWENLISGLFPLAVVYAARKYLLHPFGGTHVGSFLGLSNRFAEGIYSKELLLFLIAGIFVLGEFCESVFYFFSSGSGFSIMFFESLGRGHNFEQEVYLFEVPSIFVSWLDGSLPFSWEVAFGGDSISELLNLLLNFLSVVLLFLPGDSLDDNLSQSTVFMTFQALLTVCFSVLDILVFFIFFELMIIPMFLFFAFYSARERRMRAYWYFFFYTVVGSVPFLIGIFYLRSLLGSTSFNVIESYSLGYSDQCILWLLFAPAILFKLPLCPFHLWLPEAHVEAPTGISVFLAGILLKIGGYAYIRFLIGFLPVANANFLDFIYTITLFSCLWSAISALFQTDLKRIVAYMSIGHMSLSILALNTFTIAGFYSAIYTFLGHGLTSSALFILVGVLYDRHKVRHIKYYSGLQTVMPLFSVYVTFFIFCNIGFPGSPGFVAELLAFLSLGSISFAFLFLIFISVFILVFVNLWFLRILYGPLHTVLIKNYGDLSFFSGEHIALLLLVFGTIFLGLCPSTIFSVIHDDVSYYLLRGPVAEIVRNY